MQFIKKLLPAQYDFVFSDDRHPAIVGGLGSGKSEAGIMRTMRLILENKGANMLYAMPTYDLLRLRAIPGFEEFLTNAKIEYTLNKAESIIKIKNYGDVIFRSYDNPKRIIAFEVFGAIVDELDTLKKEDADLVWRKITERVRQEVNGKPNSIGCVTTPDMGYNGFIYKKWFEEKKQGYSVIKASTFDNPFLPPEYVQNILDNYDPILADLYLRGEIVSLNQNKIYHFYNRIKHYTNKTVSDFKHLHIGIDFNINGCVAIVYGLESNKLYAVDEFVSYDTFDFINNLTRYKDKQLSIYPDASGQNRKTNASDTDVGMIRNAGFMVYVNSRNPAVRDRINSMNGLLSHDRLLINYDKCIKFAHALESQGYDDKGEPEKSNTHPSIDDYNDSGGYCVSYLFPVNVGMQRIKTSGF